MKIERDMTSPPVVFSDEGILFHESTSPERQAYLLQLAEIGYAKTAVNGHFITWGSIYELVADPDHSDSVYLLKLPEFVAITPVLASSGALSDSTFQIAISGWRGRAGNHVQGGRVIHGGLVEIAGRRGLLEKHVWRLVDAVFLYAAIPEDQRTVETNYHHWGQIRKYAISASAGLDNFLVQTIVLTPNTLRLELEMIGEPASRKVMVSPTFNDAPTEWLARFDRLPTIPPYYNIPVADGGIVHVAVSKPVKKVLETIKRLMPNRIVRGKRAQAFIRNPYAVLGDDAVKVIPPEEFEESVRNSGIAFYTFDLDVHYDARGNIQSVSMILEATRSCVIPAIEKFSFKTPDALVSLIEEIRFQLLESAPCFSWNGYEVELRGDGGEKLARMEAWLEKWRNPSSAVTYEEIYQFPDYSKRVIEIGKRKPYYSPFILKANSDPAWLPDDTMLVICGESGDGDERTRIRQLIRNRQELSRFESAYEKARSEGLEAVEIDGLPRAIPTNELGEIVRLVKGAMDAVEMGRPPENAQRLPIDKKDFIIGINIKNLDYLEGSLGPERFNALAFDKNRPAMPELPIGIQPGCRLKDHQLVGVAWLQHLWKRRICCSGCLMADDMGLGKTLQLLAFLAWYLEKPGALPVLIVAPLGLLENWIKEMDKFLQPDWAKVLTLYGKHLTAKKAPKSLIDTRLLEDGMTNFLVDDWLGDSNVVLTTYETMRDLSISLGRQEWGVMICDEAQKIKTPGTLVTDSAKAQKARFKIACTGTPVENSLTDLWCLFDFVQPGLLGPLNRFGLRYRRPIEIERNGNDDEQRKTLNELQELIEPQILRRTKADVAKDLPVKFDDNFKEIRDRNRIRISDYQRQLYATELQIYKQRLAKAAGEKERGNPILATLHRLRAICVDPRPVNMQPNYSLSVEEYCRQSPKFNWLIGILDEVQEKNEKVLIFTEFLDLQRLLQHYLKQHYKFGSGYPRIVNGSVKVTSGSSESRQGYINEFMNSSGFNILILSPLAAGFGLNIQAANHVIHYTRPWNPAKEDQASDRAYRIGQTKDVFVYYPTVYGDGFLSFEAKLDDLLRDKRKLASDMLNGTMEANPEDFKDILGQDSGEAAEDIRISPDKLPQIHGLDFEKLCAILWSKQGYNCLQTKRSGDQGIDIVAIKSSRGLLIQCKSASQSPALGWEAVKDVVAGAPSYERQYPDVKFDKVAATNRSFNKNAVNQAEIHGVTLVDGNILSEWLDRYKIKLSEISA